MGHRPAQLIFTDGRVDVVVVLDKGPDGVRLLHSDIQNGLSGNCARFEFGIQPLHPVVLQEQLQPVPQRVHVEGRPGAQLNTVAEVGGTKPFGAVNFDVTEPSLHNLHRDRAIDHRLIRQHRA
jgi:hypothetical protein